LENIIAEKNLEILELNKMLEQRIPLEEYEVILARQKSLEKMVSL